MKITFKCICIAVISAIMLSSCYIQKEQEQYRTIYVTGTGSASSVPDTATVNFTVVTAGWSAKSIVTDNDTLTNRLVESVKNAGVNPDDIQFSECTVSMPSSQYEAKRSVKVTVRNLKIVPAVIDCKIPGNQVRLGATEFSVADESNLLRRAKTAAIQNAQDAASLLSGASGCKIGLVSSIYEDEITKEAGKDGKITATVKVGVTYNLQ